MPIVLLLVCLILTACGGGKDYDTLDEGYCPVQMVVPNTPVIESTRKNNEYKI